MHGSFEQCPKPAQVGARFFLSAAALVLFFVLFVLQLLNVKKGYLQTQFITVSPTICSSKDYHAGKLGNYTYAGNTWASDSKTGHLVWEQLADGPNMYPCSAMQSLSRKYVFNVDFPCYNFTLCNDTYNVATPWDLNDYSNKCFPTPRNRLAGLQFANDGDVRTEVWDSAFDDKTRDRVKQAGEQFCKRVKRLNTIRLSPLSTLTTASKLHGTVVSALTDKLAQCGLRCVQGDAGASLQQEPGNCVFADIPGLDGQSCDHLCTERGGCA